MAVGVVGVVGVVVVTLMDRFRLLWVLLRTIMADKGTYRDAAAAVAAADVAVDVEIAIHSSLFLSNVVVLLLVITAI